MNLLKLNEYGINIKLEIFRGLKYECILKNFIFSCNQNLGKEIFNKKKTCIRTLTNILASWMFTLYSNYDFNDDPFFPTDCSDTKNLKDTLINFCKFDKRIKEVNEKVDLILNTLSKVYYSCLEELKTYKKSDENLKSSSNYTLKKVDKLFEREGKNKEFYKFIITHDFNINLNRLSNIIDNILIPKDVYINLKNKYTGEEEYFDIYIWIMIYRYQLLGSNNNQLGVLPDNLLKMKNDFGLDFELFGSSVNFTLSHYCSLYYDIEKYFGSSGSFFNYKVEKGVYSLNPPYQTDIITRGIERLFYFLDQNTLNFDDSNRLTFIITIPIWDNIGKKIMKYKHPEKKLIEEIDYGDFEIIKKIVNSRYYKLKLMISKNDFTYLDHNFNLYKNSTIQNTYIFVLSNDSKKDFSKLNEYNFKDY
tara:strand:- start:1299 stop:2555 length:1257 start_codon:yes stop_codon:yes gene_type:complete